MTARLAVFAEPIRAGELAMWRRILAPVDCRVEAPSGSGDDELHRLATGAHIILVRRRPITARVIAHAPQLKLIQKIGLIPDNIDIAAAHARGITVATAVNPAWVGVAEHAILLMLAVSKQLLRGDRAVRTGQNPDNLPPEPTTETKYAYNWAKIEPLTLLNRKRLGLIGFGEIGQLVAVRARAFGMEVRYYRRRGPVTGAPADAEWQPLDDLLRESDYVSLHVPFTTETAGLIGRRELGLLKPTAYLINTARGGIVDQDALVEMLATHRIAGAGLDVYREEPLPSGHPLTRLDNVVLTPHCAAIRPETMTDPFPEIVANIRQIAVEATT